MSSPPSQSYAGAPPSQSCSSSASDSMSPQGQPPPLSLHVHDEGEQGRAAMFRRERNRRHAKPEHRAALHPAGRARRPKQAGKHRLSAPGCRPAGRRAAGSHSCSPTTPHWRPSLPHRAPPAHLRKGMRRGSAASTKRRPSPGPPLPRCARGSKRSSRSAGGRRSSAASAPPSGPTSCSCFCRLPCAALPVPIETGGSCSYSRNASSVSSTVMCCPSTYTSVCTRGLLQGQGQSQRGMGRRG